VRVLGGLMALGYEVGTVMRRTSTQMTSVTSDLTVKLDDVAHLGTFVQVRAARLRGGCRRQAAERLPHCVLLP
jgi:adenylate cyclase class IV